MEYDVYYVDAFADKLFAGNPAAVIFSDLQDSELMQLIAYENNLSETAFIRQDKGVYYIRWFAPSCEIDLCGHATLAAAFIYFSFIDEHTNEIKFVSSKNGTLNVLKEDNYLYLDFPSDHLTAVQYNLDIENALGIKSEEIYKGRDDYLVILNSESDVINLNPNFNKFNAIDSRGLIVTSESENYDFVSRCFFPTTGVNEDPVTGSAHTSLIPYWSKRLNKKIMLARQASKRGGVLRCEDRGDRVKIGGNAILYMKGKIYI